MYKAELDAISLLSTSVPGEEVWGLAGTLNEAPVRSWSLIKPHCSTLTLLGRETVSSLA